MNPLKPPVMNDHAPRDPRSVAAMLRGQGDGRERPYLRFHARLREREPGLDEAAIAARYSARVKAKARQTRRLARFARLCWFGVAGLVKLTLRLAGFCLRWAVLLALGLLKAAFDAPPASHTDTQLITAPPRRGLRTPRNTLGRPR